MLELIGAIAFTLILLAKVMSWLEGDNPDMAEYYRAEYRNEYRQRDKSDPNWWKHLQ